MNLKKPSAAQIGDPSDLLSLLVDYYDALLELDGKRSPSKLPGLKAITAATIAALRQTPGDDSGEAGPRVALLSGGASVLDGLQGAFAWDSTSTARDDNSATINPSGAKPGRWRRIVWSGINLILPSTSGRVLAIRSLTGTSTAKTPGTTMAWVRIWAGGGGGGGAASGVNSYGSGGAQGGYAELITTNIPAANWTHVVGGGGSGGNGAGTDGLAGSDSTFTDSAVTVTAFAGPGGKGDTTGTVSLLGGVAPAVSTNGTINGSGEPGGNALLGSWTGQGGGIGGGQSVSGGVAAGNSAVGFSGGGSGGLGSAGSGAAGGNGKAGKIILVELS